MSRKILSFLITACLCFVFAFAVQAAPQKREPLQNHDPLVDYSTWTVEKGKLKDKTGNAFITPGATFQECEGPLGPNGIKGFYFDGLKTSVSILDATKINKNFDGFDYSISFWFRLDEFQNVRADAKLSGNSLGFNFNFSNAEGFNFRIGGYGGGGFNTWSSMNGGRWNLFAAIYSVQQRVLKVYINGRLVANQDGWGKFYPLNMDKSGKYRFGSFKGAIAGLKMWDKPVAPEQFLNIPYSKAMRDELHEKIDKILKDTDHAPGAKMITDVLNEEIAEAEKNADIPLEKFNRLLDRIRRGARLVKAINELKKTNFRNSPFAFMQVRSISGEQRNPLNYPQDAVYTDVCTEILAKDEYTSVSFMIFPYHDIEKLEFEISDLKGENGGIIPKSEIEMKYVQCWFQPGWNSYFNGHGSYNPGLLLNDPTLLKIDEQTTVNYLRIDYPDGPKYCDITIPGSVLKHPGFNWMFEPVKDADTLQPIPCKFGKNCQMWMDIHAPKDSKAGIYRGTVKIKADGKNAGSFTLALRVLPFELPLPMTQFDPKKPFTQHLCSGYSIGSLSAGLKDPDHARDLVWRHIINQKKHSMFMQPFSLNIDRTDEFLETLEMQRKAGLRIQIINGPGAIPNVKDEGVPLYVSATPERCAKDYAQWTENLDKYEKFLDEHLGRHDLLYFQSVDEAQDAGTFRFMMGHKQAAMRHSFKTMTTGWEENYQNDTCCEVYHTTAAHVDWRNARKWHYIKGEITSYAAPFIGPDNPELMRRTHGLEMYKNDYDGWWELAYDSGRYHTWDHRFGYDTTYRPFRFVVDVPTGPIINTIAFCGMREGQDDVRYATLMDSLINECIESGDPKKMIPARKARMWFRGLPLKYPGDLYTIRAGMTHHIIELMKLLGKPLK